MDTFLMLWVLAWGNNAYNELTEPPPEVIITKLPVLPELYYPDLENEMWDTNWIDKKV